MTRRERDDQDAERRRPTRRGARTVTASPGRRPRPSWSRRPSTRTSRPAACGAARSPRSPRGHAIERRRTVEVGIAPRDQDDGAVEAGRARRRQVLRLGALEGRGVGEVRRAVLEPRRLMEQRGIDRRVRRVPPREILADPLRERDGSADVFASLAARGSDAGEERPADQKDRERRAAPWRTARRRGARTSRAARARRRCRGNGPTRAPTTRSTSPARRRSTSIGEGDRHRDRARRRRPIAPDRPCEPGEAAGRESRRRAARFRRSRAPSTACRARGSWARAS